MNYTELSRAELLAHKAQLEAALEAKPEWVPKPGEMVEASTDGKFMPYLVDQYDKYHIGWHFLRSGQTYLHIRPHRPAKLGLWVAVDKNGAVFIHNRKPIRQKDYEWSSNSQDYDCMRLVMPQLSSVHSDMTWEDEPREI